MSSKALMLAIMKAKMRALELVYLYSLSVPLLGMMLSQLGIAWILKARMMET